MNEIHEYLSTACLHGHHRYCQSREGSDGTVIWVKKPSECKFCESTCECACHQEGDR